jgi:hypothetical protein
MSKDFNGQPASKYDDSHLSVDVRAQLGKLTPELAAGVRRIADAPVIGRAPTWADGVRLAKSAVPK